VTNAEPNLRSILVRAIQESPALEVIAAAADLLAADARFNLWIATEVKPDPERAGGLLNLVEPYQNLVDECARTLPPLVAADDVAGFRRATAAVADRLARLRLDRE
jgi:hypothetical protein